MTDTPMTPETCGKSLAKALNLPEYLSLSYTPRPEGYVMQTDQGAVHSFGTLAIYGIGSVVSRETVHGIAQALHTQCAPDAPSAFLQHEVGPRWGQNSVEITNPKMAKGIIKLIAEHAPSVGKTQKQAVAMRKLADTVGIKPRLSRLSTLDVDVGRFQNKWGDGAEGLSRIADYGRTIAFHFNTPEQAEGFIQSMERKKLPTVGVVSGKMFDTDTTTAVVVRDQACARLKASMPYAFPPYTLRGFGG